MSQGVILFDGKPRNSRTKRHLGYILQDDLFFSNLTVRQCLQFTADVRLPSSLTADEKRKIIDDLLDSLRLTECQHTRVGDQQFDKGISGGERKRLNIANELISNPSVILADECTSGLDSSSAYTVVQILKRLSREGKTVIATIHQPSTQIFYVFDKILLLASGQVAYFGKPQGVTSYFSSIGFPLPNDSYNPADFMLDLVIGDFSGPQTNDEELGESSAMNAKSRILKEWEERRNVRKQIEVLENPQDESQEELDSNHSPQIENVDAKILNESVEKHRKGPIRAIQKRYFWLVGQQHRDPLPNKYTTNVLAQILALGKRSLLQKKGKLIEKKNIVLSLSLTFVCMLFWFRIRNAEDTLDDRIGSLFFISVCWSFFSLYSALETFPAERAVLNKERSSGLYRLSAYYLAKTTIDVPTDVLHPVLFCIVVYYPMNLNSSFSSFVLFIFLIILTVLVAVSIGVLLSASFVQVTDAQVFGTVYILCSMLFSGFYIDSKNVPSFLRPLRFISYLKYIFEAMVRNELRGQTFSCASVGGPDTLNSQNGRSCPITEMVALERAQLDEISILGNIAIALLLIVLLRLAGYFALKHLHAPHKRFKRSTTSGA